MAGAAGVAFLAACGLSCPQMLQNGVFPGGRGPSRSPGSNPPVSQGFQPAGRADHLTRSKIRRPADWKSAIQQVGNLRYVEPAGLCQQPWTALTRAAALISSPAAPRLVRACAEMPARAERLRGLPAIQCGPDPVAS